ncbi:hypothetical protein XBP1_750002 [Xenorhabdus bovienii str. puntauvense]|uniref:Uncharacterized protein n=1 Tax=Xenorhabdus bovienii str. puntauvense TaxID=1398201 RepID=A0A077NND2_XENBV|nr:hypothetical protein [Xenorhabdus bovienii]CDG99185.1 hypothetical protein XBP1_750002 [Xenorhabdus bovienii str. puntauvense]
MQIDEKQTIHLKITLTAEEYEILKNLSDLEGKPMATVLMKFIREAGVFKTLRKCLKAVEAIQNFKNIFRKNVSRMADDI